MAKLPIFMLEVASDPLVFCIASGWPAKKSFEICLSVSRGRKFHLLIIPYWHVANEAANLKRFSDFCAQFANVCSITFLCPNESDKSLLNAMQLDAIHTHQNAFIDETIFRPLENTTKIFDAVHNAASTRFKRHHLAYNIENIAVITYKHLPTDGLDIVKQYKSLAYCNLTPDGDIDYLPQNSVVNILNKSKCGLILSKVEGANFASGEYQFCGLPVVTTHSKGGRIDFVDKLGSSIVWPLRWSVNRAVEYWVRHQPDPAEIHRQTIERAIPHRERLLDFLSGVTGRNMRQLANRNAWLPTFKDKLRNRIMVEMEKYEEI